jgi:PhnB protein
MPLKHIPEGHHSVTPYLISKGAAEAIESYKKAFGATESFRMPDETAQRVGHAEFTIGDSHIRLAGEYPDMGYPQSTFAGRHVGQPSALR